MNVYSEMHSMAGFGGNTHNKTGALGASAVTVQLSIAGWYKISADVDFHWQGPSSTTVTATTADCHEWAQDTTPPIYVKAGYYVSLIRAGSTAGTYHINRIKGP